MQFIDDVTIEVQSGNGGSGCMSFYRSRNIAKGGPDGGDGGRGGDVIVRAVPHLNTLFSLKYKTLHKAGSGASGKSRHCHGKQGEPCYIDVPAGTLLLDCDSKTIIADLKVVGQEVVVADGGMAGRGNLSYKSSVNRAPRAFTKGGVGERKRLRFYLKLLSDVALLGLPNAGKSTFVSSVSSAKVKVADYPFTTLNPQLAVVELNPIRSFVLSDMPGLIEGASKGSGLGLRFLKHLARTNLLLQFIELDSIDNMLSNIALLDKELFDYSEALAQLPRWIVVTKLDLISNYSFDFERLKCAEALVGRPIFAISSVTQEGVGELLSSIMDHVEKNKADSTVFNVSIEEDAGLQGENSIENEELRSYILRDILAHDMPDVCYSQSSLD